MRGKQKPSPRWIRRLRTRSNTSVHAVDTNLLVRLVTGDDLPQTARATAVFESEEIWIAKTVLLETEWVLRRGYEFASSTIKDAIERLLSLPGVQVEDPAAIATALDLFGQGMDF